MDRILVSLILLFMSAISLPAQITSNGNVCYRAGDLARYASATTMVNPTYDYLNGTVICRLGVTAPSTTNIIAEYTYATTKIVIDTYTGTGTGDTAKFHHACQQAVKAYLESLTENSGITFVIP